MKALVLTYDRNHFLTVHMIRQYNKLWPDHPFQFYVPYQIYPEELVAEFGQQIQPVMSNPSIPDTIRTLLDVVEDSEWVLWAIDDRYLQNVNLKAVKTILASLDSGSMENISGIMLCRALKLKKTNIRNNSKQYIRHIPFYEKTDWKSFWVHHFVRGSLLKYVFGHFPDRIIYAKEMDYIKNRIKFPDELKYLVSNKSYMVFGESTVRGRLTANCVKSLEKHGIHYPQTIVADKQLVKYHGNETWSKIDKSKYFITKFINRSLFYLSNGKPAD
jgi:hypothetical protein